MTYTAILPRRLMQHNAVWHGVRHDKMIQNDVYDQYELIARKQQKTKQKQSKAIHNQDMSNINK